MSDGNATWYLGKFGASNRATWILDWTVVDTDDEPIDLTSATFSMGIYDAQKSLVLSGSTADGVISLITSDDNNQFRWTFSDTQMRALDPGSYKVGLTIEIASIVTQLFTGDLSIYDGFVP